MGGRVGPINDVAAQSRSSRFRGVRTSAQLSANDKADGQPSALVSGGDDEDRTHDLRIANAALSQLSYVPTRGRIIAGPGADVHSSQSIAVAC